MALVELICNTILIAFHESCMFKPFLGSGGGAGGKGYKKLTSNFAAGATLNGLAQTADTRSNRAAIASCTRMVETNDKDASPLLPKRFMAERPSRFAILMPILRPLSTFVSSLAKLTLQNGRKSVLRLVVGKRALQSFV